MSCMFLHGVIAVGGHSHAVAKQSGKSLQLVGVGRPVTRVFGPPLTARPDHDPTVFVRNRESSTTASPSVPTTRNDMSRSGVPCCIAPRRSLRWEHQIRVQPFVYTRQTVAYAAASGDQCRFTTGEGRQSTQRGGCSSRDPPMRHRRGEGTTAGRSAAGGNRRHQSPPSAGRRAHPKRSPAGAAAAGGTCSGSPRCDAGTPAGVSYRLPLRIGSVRLLGQHMLAGLDGGEVPRAMQAVGQRVVDRLDFWVVQTSRYESSTRSTPCSWAYASA